MRNILKFFLVDFCVCAMLFYSCTTSVPILDSGQLEEHGRTGNIHVLTKDGTLYRLQSYVLTDSLIVGEGTIDKNKASQPFSGSIKFSEIAAIEADNIHAVKTFVMIAAVTTMAILISPSFRSQPNLESGVTIDEHWNFRSCPFVYTYDGERYHFESETFAGAIFPSAERASYDVLRYLKEVDGTYKLKLTAEREETNYVNEISLTAIDAPMGLEIIPDCDGIPHTIAEKIAPSRCNDFDGNDASADVRAPDSVFWESNIAQKDFSTAAQFRDGLILEFEKPLQVREAKLVVRGVNTALGVFALQNLMELTGGNKLRWLQQLKTDDRKSQELLRFMKREGMLHVSVWINDRWQEQTMLYDVGPGLVKDQLTILNLENVHGSTCRVKLESTIDLWKIDEVYIDYSRDAQMQTTPLTISSARTETGMDITPLLRANDDQYYVSLKGDVAELIFTVPQKRTHSRQSIILKSKGYYYQWVHTSGKDRSLMLERILADPSLGARTLLPLWKSVRHQYR